MKLFEVRLKSYQSYHVEAKSYNDAAKKVEAYVEFESQSKCVIDADGSLSLGGDNRMEVSEIRVIADFIIR